MERGVIFTGGTVLAILAGRKTVTRRVGKRWAAFNPGDTIWVRESFRRDADGVIHFHADEPVPAGHRWTAAFYLPRVATRVVLRVTRNLLEPLHELTAAEAVAEGIDPAPLVCADCPPGGYCQATAAALIAGYRDLWASLHGPDSWARNPAVHAISFHREAPPCP